MKQKLYTTTGLRLSSEQRKAIRKAGLYCYGLRDSDNSFQIEHYVVINHVGDLITNFRILDGRKKHDYYPDLDEYLYKVQAISTTEFYNKVRAIIGD